MSAGERRRLPSETMELSGNSVVVAIPHHVSADMGEEVILLHLENGLYFGLGNVGARIWKLLQKPVKVSEIESLLMEEYDVDPGRCHEEVMKLVVDLVGQGLVTVEAE